MPNTYTSLHYHIVFSTKNREQWLVAAKEARIWEYLGGIARTNGMKALKVGGYDDHIHILLALPATISVSKAVQLLKGASSRWSNFSITHGEAHPFFCGVAMMW